MKINFVSSDHSKFPKNLKDIHSAPKGLYYLGLLPTDITPALAIIGTRRPTPYGTKITLEFGEQLTRAGITIVSGLALGVDGLAHRACLKAKGKTIAVLGCGLDQIYPSTHRELAQQILQTGGGIISEYEAGTPALPQNFIARNRLVSGLADGVLITEAAAKSGTLHTANFALEQGKAVMVVPGNITSPMSAGTNHLIKTGALPITCVEDVLNVMGMKTKTKKQKVRGDNEVEQTIIDLLASGITDGEELQSQSELPATEFQQHLSLLEIKGVIQPLGANHWSLR
jgi:DNA processing protein